MGKSSKSRSCPALGRNISPADCGEQRESHLACTADCPHNPFGPDNYSKLLEIENRLDIKTADHLLAAAPDLAAKQYDDDGANGKSLHATHAFLVWNLFFAEDANKTTFARRWEQSGLAELKNDERVLLRAKMQTRIALVEVHRVFDGGRFETVDLLSANPKPVILLDRSLGAVALRFSTFLAWIYPTPHFWRLSGTATVIPDVAEFSAPEIVRETVRHLGGPPAEPEMRRWLAEHFVRFDAALRAVAQLRREQMLAGLDAKWGKAVYELRAPFSQCRERLDALNDVEPDELSDKEKDEGFSEARVWFDDAPHKMQKSALPGGQPVLGRVLLGQSLWRLETLGVENLSRLRRQFERHLGDRVRLAGERVDDLGSRLTQKKSAVDISLAPPRLLEDPDEILLTSSSAPAPPPGVSFKDLEQELWREADLEFLDKSIPALDHRTPREAARNPALRPKLVQLMKRHVREHDERNLKTGRADDINWLLRELELNEIIFEAPPLRQPPGPLPYEDQDSPEWDDLDDLPEPEPNRPPAPPLPDKPLPFNKAVDRLENALGTFETSLEAENELHTSGSTLLEDAEELTLDHLTENDFYFAMPFLLQAWFSLVPRGCRAPEIPFDGLEKAFADNLRQLETHAKARTQKKLMSFLQNGPQPNLMLVLATGLFEVASAGPKKFRPALDAQPVILALLKAVIEKLDAALRQKHDSR